jgi:hypothetical protein
MNQFLGWQDRSAEFLNGVARFVLMSNPGKYLKVTVTWIGDELIINCFPNLKTEIELIREAYEGKL